MVLASLLVTGSCSDEKSATEHAVAAESTAVHEEESNFVELSDAQIAAVNIELAPIGQKNITATVKVNGTLEVPAQNKASVTSLYSGTIRTIDVHPGSAVRKGQVIATIANTEISGIQQQLISVTAQLRLAELEEARQRELVAGNAAPLKNLQRATAELSSMRAQRAALAKQLSTLGISASSVSTGNISSTLTVTAPISGTISDIHGMIGSRVDASTPLAEIVNNSQLHLDLFVFEKDLPRVRPGQIIHFTLTNSPGKEHDARIFSIGTAFANETKSIPVHAEVMGDKTGLIEGMSVTAIISIGSNTSPAVPTESIVTSGGKDYIFVQREKTENGSDGSMSFERVEIARGTSDLGYTEIVTVGELPPGAQIVVRGAFFVLAKMTNKADED